jgi:hypothetical protein
LAINPQASRLTVGHELPFWVSSCPRDSLSSFVRIAALSLTSRFRLRNKVLSTRSRRDRDRNHVRRKESTECHGGTDFSCWRIVLEFASNTSTLRECVSTHPVIWTTNVAYLFCKNFTPNVVHTDIPYLSSLLPASLTLASATKEEDSPTICQGLQPYFFLIRFQNNSGPRECVSVPCYCVADLAIAFVAASGMSLHSTFLFQY